MPDERVDSGDRIWVEPWGFGLWGSMAIYGVPVAESKGES